MSDLPITLQGFRKGRIGITSRCHLSGMVLKDPEDLLQLSLGFRKPESVDTPLDNLREGQLVHRAPTGSNERMEAVVLVDSQPWNIVFASTSCLDRLVSVAGPEALQGI